MPSGEGRHQAGIENCAFSAPDLSKPLVVISAVATLSNVPESNPIDEVG